METTSRVTVGGQQEHSRVKTEERLFAYQVQAVEWLQIRKCALLALEMGLGKSAITITAADKLELKRVLVLCPAVARINWLREFDKFSVMPRKFSVVEGSNASWSQEDSIITSYDMAAKIDPSLFGQFDVLILDEAHFLKTLETKRTRAIYGKEGLVRYAKRTWALTGTPAPNHAGELWPMLYTFGQTTLSYDRFVERFCESFETSYGRQITGTKLAAIPELKKILAPVMLRRKTSEVMQELPELFFNDVVVEPGIVDIELESSFTKYIFPEDRRKELEEKLIQERALVEAATGQAGLGRDGMKILEGLASSISTLRMYTGLQKVEAVAEMIKAELEANAYPKVVIFAVHRDVIEGLRTRLKDFKPVTLYGGTAPDKKQKNLDKFMNDPKTRVFIGNIQACGTAVTLTSSNQVVFIEQSWVPGDNAQAAKRCHRIGQTKPVFVRMVGLANSFDARISQVLKRKARELSCIFNKPIDSTSAQD
jgi:SWI/SNF-related matrix-associated actin-dependent regulator of chromatin subfamily A-like protein 1